METEKNFNEYNENLSKSLISNGLHHEYINIDIDKIKQYTFTELFRKNNKWNIKTPDYNETNKGLEYNMSHAENIEAFKELCKTISIKQSTKEQKLKEVYSNLDMEKQFKNAKNIKLKQIAQNKYFSMYDLQKAIKNNDLSINDVLTELKQSDKIIFSTYYFFDKYEYKRTEEKVKFLEFLYILLNNKLPNIKTIDNEPKNRHIEPSEQDFKEHNLKVKFFKEHSYYYMNKDNNKDNNNDNNNDKDEVLNFVVEKLKTRLEGGF